ncbi:unnamed protein product [Bursaphelenchus okinawaensis]|uniref:BTB domain-containing protein n=1 Tax=Bursaphelenchus okinawaensis TaxID=465554 RepID=A0A811KP74_9BILA|nr:unnamed protein product [Bursaphelenchus okinawaensis]CAG9107145.1 unnamed protein product [Bursaphelenchus okinawaensis]
MDPELIKSRHEQVQRHINWLRIQVSKIVEVPHRLELLDNQSLSDFRIIVGKRTFYVSKSFLSMKSEVFKKMFESGMKETHEGQLVLHDDEEAVEAMLFFIYGDKKIEDLNLAMKVIQLAHRYGIELLKLQCEYLIVQNLTLDLACDSLVMSKRLDLPYLALKCYEMG